MFTVYIAATEEYRNSMSAMVRETPDVILAGTATSLEVALDACARNNPGVLLLDDALLRDNAETLARCAAAPYPIVLLAHATGPAVAKRALAIGAHDLIDKNTWRDELMLTLERAADLLAGQKRAGKILAVFSPKGGVGKTTLSVNLGIALAQKTHDPVVIVDLDLAFGDVAAMVGVTPTATLHNLITPPIDMPAVAQVLVEVVPNVYALPAPINPEEAEDIRPEMVVALFEVLKAEYSYIIADLAPGYNEITITTLDSSDKILTVCTPDVVTLRTVGQSLQLFRDGFHYPASKVRLVLNRSGSKTGISSADVNALLKTHITYTLPSEGSIPARAANDGIPMVVMEPRCAMASALYAMADALIQEDTGRRGKRRPGSKGSWLGRWTRRKR